MPRRGHVTDPALRKGTEYNPFAEPEPHDGQIGQWSTDKLKRMDQSFCDRMTRALSKDKHNEPKR
jgi:hypothetical protein